MWCANCQADVAAEVTADTRRIRCATCGTTIDSSHGTRASARTREARELLERWSSGALLDPFESLAAPVVASPSAETNDLWASQKSAPQAAVATPDTPVASEPEPEPAPPQPAPAPPARRSFRIDKSHQLGEQSQRGQPTAVAAAPAPRAQASAPRAQTAPPAAAPAPSFEHADEPHEPVRTSSASYTRSDFAHSSYQHDAVDLDEDSAPRAAEPLESERPRRRRIRSHGAHDSRPSAPHFDIQELAERQELRKPNATSVTGQMLAYSGVLGLTIGTAMVVWGYFGGPDNFAPTGWLITTAGQMLLFLGVVTLVSGGMEQTTDEVARRIDHLGEKLIRIEQASRDHALRGPSIPAERFAEGAEEAPQRSRERTTHRS